MNRSLIDDLDAEIDKIERHWRKTRRWAATAFVIGFALGIVVATVLR